MAQTAYQMNDIDHVDILTKLIFEIAFEKVEKSDIEKPIFQGGAKDSNPPLYWKGYAYLCGGIYVTIRFH